MQKQPLVVICCAIVAGILAGKLAISWVSSPVWLAGSTISWLVWWAAHQKRKSFACLALLVSFGMFFAARFQEHWCRFPVHNVATIDTEGGVPLVAHCAILTVPELSQLPPTNLLATVPKGSRSTFYARVLKLRNGQNWEPASGRIQVQVEGHLLGIGVGDRVEFLGQLHPLSAPMNPGETDRRPRERNHRTTCRLRVSHPDCVRRISGPNTWSLRISGWLGRIRHSGLSLLDEHVETNSQLASALLLGARDRLAEDQIDAFFHTGTIHLLAISGLHVGILAWFFFFLAKRTTARRLTLLSLMAGAIVYCHLTGLRPPVLRAVILVQVLCIGALWRRTISSVNALATAAILILAYRPGALFLPGAQLSFLAVATLIWLQFQHQATDTDLSPIDKLLLRSRSTMRRTFDGLVDRMVQLLIASFAISVITLPLVMYRFHLCAPISIAMNLGLSIPIALALLSGFSVLCFGAWAQPIAALAGRVCDHNLGFVDATVRWAHELPAAYYWVSGPSRLYCLAFYIGLAALYCAPKLRLNLLCATAWLSVWMVFADVGQWTSQHSRPPQVECTFLSIGHGTCTVLQLPDGRTVLYDAGRMGVTRFGVGIVSEFLWSRNIDHLDAVIISHADADHYNLIPGLLDRFSIGQAFVSHRMFAGATGGVAVLQEALRQYRIPIQKLQTDDLLRFGPASIRILHPFPQGVVGSDNANSIVAEVSYQEHRILLPGDLEARGLEDVIAESPRISEVVMAPHHGSARSAPRAFMQWSSPNFVVISGGRKGTKEKAVRLFAGDDRHSFHTAFDGAITVRIQDRELTVHPFLATPQP